MGRTSPIHNVLVVDDNEQILTSWKRGAGRERHVFTATDAATARTLARAEQIDLAIVDYRLGDGDGDSGLDLVRDLRTDAPDLAIALCSGYLSIDLAVAATRAGADVVVCKPITFREVLKRLDDGVCEPVTEEPPTLARAEWEHIMRVLSDCNGNVSATARRLGIYRSSLQRKLRKYAPRA